MKTAYIFPGQGAQFSGMGKNLYETNSLANELFNNANEILKINISDIIFNGSAEDLKQTKITQPSVYLHSVITFFCLENKIQPDMVAGHSLGEFSALVASGVLSFEDGLKLVYKRALAMQKACELTPSTMAAVINLDDKTVSDICKEIQEIVVPANFNCPGQIVISGTEEGINSASEKLMQAGAKRVLKLAVGGAFHSPLMKHAQDELATAINETNFKTPVCPIYQNYDAKPHSEPDIIKQNLINQLVNPVLWSSSVQNMIADSATKFIEVGPGSVLKGLISKINPNVLIENFS
ncbi:MAG: ACP S-malonyltransferase [Bacteroidales bacterium]|jgi:[acyl-carrier-protein] S-malonyltransferase|nr:ACP S-malonyltransferase [Bacteroidales bacterium]